jgi:hypothetical protein
LSQENILSLLISMACHLEETVWDRGTDSCNYIGCIKSLHWGPQSYAMCGQIRCNNVEMCKIPALILLYISR